MKRESATSPRRVKSLEREIEAIALRRTGATEDAIAKQLGITQSAAHKAIHRALNRMAEQSAQGAELHLALAADRLERLILANWARAMAGDPRACKIVLDCIQALAKLLGYGAPDRHEVTGKNGGPVEISEEPGQLSDEELRDRVERTLAKYDSARAGGDPGVPAS